MAIDIINTDKADPLTQEEIDRLPPWRRPDWQEDAEDVLNKRLAQLQGLASCVSMLAHADRCPQVGAELADDALPSLGWVMLELTMDAVRAKDVLDRERRGERRGGLQ